MTEALPGFNLHLEEAEQRASTQAGNYPGQYGSGQASTGQQSTGQQSTGQQSASGYTRTEHSAQTPYKQQPVGSGVNS